MSGVHESGPFSELHERADATGSRPLLAEEWREWAGFGAPSSSCSPAWSQSQTLPGLLYSSDSPPSTSVLTCRSALQLRPLAREWESALLSREPRRMRTSSG
jgi:hypothetical protein